MPETYISQAGQVPSGPKKGKEFRPTYVPPSQMMGYYERARSEQEPLVTAALGVANVAAQKKPNYAELERKVEALSQQLKASESLGNHAGLSRLLKDLQYNLRVVQGKQKGEAPYDYAMFVKAGADALVGGLGSCLLSSNIAYHMEAGANAAGMGNQEQETAHYQRAMLYGKLLYDTNSGNRQIERNLLLSLSGLTSTPDFSKVWGTDTDTTRYYSKVLFNGIVQPAQDMYTLVGTPPMSMEQRIAQFDTKMIEIPAGKELSDMGIDFQVAYLRQFEKPEPPRQSIKMAQEEKTPKAPADFFTTARPSASAVGPQIKYAGLGWLLSDNPQDKTFAEGILGWFPVTSEAIMIKDMEIYRENKMYGAMAVMGVLTVIATCADIAAYPTAGLSLLLKKFGPIRWGVEGLKMIAKVGSKEKAMQLIVKESVAEREITLALQKQTKKMMKAEADRALAEPIDAMRKQIDDFAKNKADEFAKIWNRKANTAVVTEKVKENALNAYKEWADRVFEESVKGAKSELGEKLTRKEASKAFANVLDKNDAAFKLRKFEEKAKAAEKASEGGGKEALEGAEKQIPAGMDETFPKGYHPLETGLNEGSAYSRSLRIGADGKRSAPFVGGLNFPTDAAGKIHWSKYWKEYDNLETPIDKIIFGIGREPSNRLWAVTGDAIFGTLGNAYYWTKKGLKMGIDGAAEGASKRAAKMAEGMWVGRIESKLSEAAAKEVYWSGYQMRGLAKAYNTDFLGFGSFVGGNTATLKDGRNVDLNTKLKLETGEAIASFVISIPQEVIIEKQEDGAATLKWKPANNPDVSAYRIFKNNMPWRDVPAYQFSQYVVAVDDPKPQYSVAAFTGKYNDGLAEEVIKRDGGLLTKRVTARSAEKGQTAADLAVQDKKDFAGTVIVSNARLEATTGVLTWNVDPDLAKKYQNMLFKIRDRNDQLVEFEDGAARMVTETNQLPVKMVDREGKKLYQEDGYYRIIPYLPAPLNQEGTPFSVPVDRSNVRAPAGQMQQPAASDTSQRRAAQQPALQQQTTQAPAVQARQLDAKALANAASLEAKIAKLPNANRKKIEERIDQILEQHKGYGVTSEELFAKVYAVNRTFDKIYSMAEKTPNYPEESLAEMIVTNLNSASNAFDSEEKRGLRKK